MKQQSELKQQLEIALGALSKAHFNDTFDEYDQERLEEIIETLDDLLSGVAR